MLTEWGCPRWSSVLMIDATDSNDGLLGGAGLCKSCALCFCPSPGQAITGHTPDPPLVAQNHHDLICLPRSHLFILHHPVGLGPGQKQVILGAGRGAGLWNFLCYLSLPPTPFPRRLKGGWGS